MYIISVSYGNDSVAMIRLAYEYKLSGSQVVYCETGWAHPSWEDRILQGEGLAKEYGFTPHRIRGELLFADMVRKKKGFPHHRSQFCTGILKGIPFLKYCEENDIERNATVLIGKRREESKARENTPEYIEDSKYHGGRTVWHPLYLHNEEQRNELVLKTGMEVLPHRSLECSPCVNAKKADFQRVESARIDEIRALEAEVEHPMFRPAKKMGAFGIDEVLRWAVSPRGRYTPTKPKPTPRVNEHERKWFWMMSFCKRMEIPHAEKWAWDMAETAYLSHE